MMGWSGSRFSSLLLSENGLGCRLAVSSADSNGGMGVDVSREQGKEELCGRGIAAYEPGESK